MPHPKETQIGKYCPASEILYTRNFKLACNVMLTLQQAGDLSRVHPTHRVTAAIGSSAGVAPAVLFKVLGVRNQIFVAHFTENRAAQVSRSPPGHKEKSTKAHKTNIFDLLPLVIRFSTLQCYTQFWGPQPAKHYFNPCRHLH